jgi:hypothetical protein
MRTIKSWLLLSLTTAFLAAPASAQTVMSPNQTLGFGRGDLLLLTYTQNFDCIDQPSNDLDYNGKKAGSDPAEMQTPICVVGTQPTINPPGHIGNPQMTTAPLYVLVPMFSVDNDQNPNDAISCTGVVQGTLCGQQLGQTLISLFGAIPEGFKAHPLVYSQCPDPGLPPGTCTMHASRLDLGPVLAALGFIPPPTQNVFLPTPNHSHVVKDDDINDPPIWWQVIPVLVLNQSDWPPQNGSSGLTSVEAIMTAEQAGRAVQAPSNFFLFFSTMQTTAHMDHMQMEHAH